jgi:hypothetical protein
MTIEGLVLVAMGIGFAAYGYSRARTFWSRYQGLAAQQANVERYERWRGGARPGSAEGPTEQMRILRRRAAIYGLLVLVGFLFIFEGFNLP